ncbi:hypothetical protein HK102_009845 [Quaeritorhiza haematococci]|nr:hypothetical protein HK102_009845 [Quaeritorhiza haematococci]
MTLGSGIANGLRTNEKVKTLDLSGCRLQTQNAIEIAEALRANDALEVLNLDNNQIAPMGIKALAEMLEVNTTLKELRIGQQKQQAGTDAEQQIAKAMQKNTTLQKLSLQIRDVASRNQIDRYITRNKEIARKKRLAAAQAARQVEE